MLELYKKFTLFYDNVEYISKLKCGNLPSLSNKIIFKNLDIIEKYNIINIT